MIIGLSGKKQAGKNTVAKIINFLLTGGLDTYDSFEGFSEYYQDGFTGEKQFPYKEKLFADKLKDIVCLLINCTREQLEDNVFKETPLGEEWRVFYFIAIFSDKSKSINPRITRLYLSEEEAWSSDNNYACYKGAETMYKLVNELLTPRKLLQLIGTEAGRNTIHPNIWVNTLMSEYKPIGGYGQARLTKGGIVPANPKFETIDVYSNWIITDVRFPNELKAIEEEGGLVIRINNPRIISTDTHFSETALDNHTFGTTLTNDDTIETLINKTRRILEIHKLL